MDNIMAKRDKFDFESLDYRPDTPPEPSPELQTPPDWGIIAKHYIPMVTELKLKH